ncbi:MAG: hypothetical protein GWO38_15635, partial [Phycisphaerae bacterium]|nr:hypothetical protein [Phycisphaerae bacterium]NIP52982.1 hypothetical protein [Phycisphaerae bacterium]NIW46797.1 hypothetical protein [Gammaproteobacteria bacterium]NIX29016.1 hypothetical protein [Phycisphaerae bacterium]
MRVKNFSQLFVITTYLLMLTACTSESTAPVGRATPTTADSPTLETADSDVVDSLIASLTDAGADVMNDGRTSQGLFPGDDIFLWHLTVNGANVKVFEFLDPEAREVVSDNILPNGSEYVVVEGDTTVVTHWD